MTPERRAAEEVEARAYADAIKANLPTTDWSRWNGRIIDRWSLSALRRIKNRAWKIVELVR